MHRQSKRSDRHQLLGSAAEKFPKRTTPASCPRDLLAGHPPIPPYKAPVLARVENRIAAIAIVPSLASPDEPETVH